MAGNEEAAKLREQLRHVIAKAEDGDSDSLRTGLTEFARAWPTLVPSSTAITNRLNAEMATAERAWRGDGVAPGEAASRMKALVAEMEAYWTERAMRPPEVTRALRQRVEELCSGATQADDHRLVNAARLLLETLEEHWSKSPPLSPHSVSAERTLVLRSDAYWARLDAALRSGNLPRPEWRDELRRWRADVNSYLRFLGTETRRSAEQLRLDLVSMPFDRQLD